MNEKALNQLVRDFVQAWSHDLLARVSANDEDDVSQFVEPLAMIDFDAVVDPLSSSEIDQTHPSLRWLDSAIDAIDVPGDFGSLAGTLARRVKWRGLYEGGGVEPELAQGMSAGRIAGPGGLIDSDQILAGFFLLSPGVYYPKHDHEAEEIYQALSGRTDVSHGIDAKPVSLQQGGFIFQPSYVVHDLRVSEAPSLMLYLWVGNLGVPTWWWRQDSEGAWWRDCWERQPDLTMNKTRSERV